jgi:hypothetical protein
LYINTAINGLPEDLYNCFQITHLVLMTIITPIALIAKVLPGVKVLTYMALGVITNQTNF